MSAINLNKWDLSEHLKTEEEAILYLDACLAEADLALIVAALGDLSRLKGMHQIAEAAGLSRETLEQALSGEGNPDFSTVMKVVKALGIQLRASPINANDAALTGQLKLGQEFMGEFQETFHALAQ